MDKNYIKYLIIIVISVSITIMFTRFCTNTDNEFDNSIFWSAVSSITGICGFIGVVYTLYKNEQTRNRQNEYELRKGYLIKEQEEFKRVCYEELEKISPKELLNTVKKYTCNEENEIGVMNSVYEHQMNVNEFIGNIKFFYKYKNEKINIFEKNYIDYSEELSNLLDKMFHLDKKNTKEIDLFKEIVQFHTNKYEKLRSLVIELVDGREFFIEEELKNINKDIK